jgi:hypothetical protein
MMTAAVTEDGDAERTHSTRSIHAVHMRKAYDTRAPLLLAQPLVMIGGLVTSTLFTLFALPTFYAFVHRWQERMRDVAEEGART